MWVKCVMIERSYLSKFCHAMYNPIASNEKLKVVLHYPRALSMWFQYFFTKIVGLLCLDFSLLFRMKSLICKCPCETVMRLVVVTGDTRKILGVFPKMRQSKSDICPAGVYYSWQKIFWVILLSMYINYILINKMFSILYACILVLIL